MFWLTLTCFTTVGIFDVTTGADLSTPWERASWPAVAPGAAVVVDVPDGAERTLARVDGRARVVGPWGWHCGSKNRIPYVM